VAAYDEIELQRRQLGALLAMVIGDQDAGLEVDLRDEDGVRLRRSRQLAVLIHVAKERSATKLPGRRDPAACP
jgi:hypothetical protein